MGQEIKVAPTSKMLEYQMYRKIKNNQVPVQEVVTDEWLRSNLSHWEYEAVQRLRESIGEEGYSRWLLSIIQQSYFKAP